MGVLAVNLDGLDEGVFLALKVYQVLQVLTVRRASLARKAYLSGVKLVAEVLLVCLAYQVEASPALKASKVNQVSSEALVKWVSRAQWADQAYAILAHASNHHQWTTRATVKP